MEDLFNNNSFLIIFLVGYCVIWEGFKCLRYSFRRESFML